MYSFKIGVFADVWHASQYFSETASLRTAQCCDQNDPMFRFRAAPMCRSLFPQALDYFVVYSSYKKTGHCSLQI
ncbi:hypothetical protein AX768_22845 [Burkholderia sp. PAMC 28687]|nr:hypothetical protein AX768_22845 [Burkholderia sp. PAMC 28687]